jgi:hypothetical protein
LKSERETLLSPWSKRSKLGALSFGFSIVDFPHLRNLRSVLQVKSRMIPCQRKMKSFGEGRRLDTTDFKTSLKRFLGFFGALFFP